eukprot:6430444-Amphidinium_carterae.1
MAQVVTHCRSQELDHFTRVRKAKTLELQNPGIRRCSFLEHVATNRFCTLQLVWVGPAFCRPARTGKDGKDKGPLDDYDGPLAVPGPLADAWRSAGLTPKGDKAVAVQKVLHMDEDDGESHYTKAEDEGEASDYQTPSLTITWIPQQCSINPIQKQHMHP